jgi:copper(I)-binding protein
MYKKILLLLAILSFIPNIFAADLNSKTTQHTGLEITSPWARPSMSAQGNSAAYLAIKNNSDKDYKLISATATIANNIELHNSFVDQTGVSRMIKIDNIVIPAGSTITLAPGKMHIMLFGLQKALNVGDKFNLQLLFENADPQTVEVIVKSGN